MHRPAGITVAGRPGMVASPTQTSWSRYGYLVPSMSSGVLIDRGCGRAQMRELAWRDTPRHRIRRTALASGGDRARVGCSSRSSRGGLAPSRAAVRPGGCGHLHSVRLGHVVARGCLQRIVAQCRKTTTRCRASRRRPDRVAANYVVPRVPQRRRIPKSPSVSVVIVAR